MGLLQNGIVESITMGGVTIALSRAITLTATVSTTGNYTTFRRNGQPYRVPSGKTLKVLAVRGASSGTNTDIGNIGYADSVALNETTPPSNAVLIQSSPTSGAAFCNQVPWGHADFPYYAEIPSQKYPLLRGVNGVGSMVELLCVEE